MAPGLLSCWKSCVQPDNSQQECLTKASNPLTHTQQDFSNPSSDFRPPLETCLTQQNEMTVFPEKVLLNDNSIGNITHSTDNDNLLNEENPERKFSVDEDVCKSVNATRLLSKPHSTPAIRPQPPISPTNVMLTYRHPLNITSVSNYHHRRTTRVNFEVPGPAEQIFRKERLPSQVIALIVYLAREAIAVRDLFRRPGSNHDVKKILRQLRDGSRVTWTQYSFHTLAGVAKRFLLSVQGGILGMEAEHQMIGAMGLQTPELTMESMHKVIIGLSLPVQCLLVLLFGTWFRMMYHSDVNNMSLEAVAKSVAGSVFLNTCSHLDQVEKATQAMEFLICSFPRSSLFGPQLLHYFTQRSKTYITGVECYQYSFICPPNVPRKECSREFVRILKAESDRHNFDLLRDVASQEQFEVAFQNNEINYSLPLQQFQIQNVNGSESAGMESAAKKPTPATPYHRSADDLQSDQLSNFDQHSSRYSCPSQELLSVSSNAVIKEEGFFRDSSLQQLGENTVWDNCSSLTNAGLHQRHRERLRRRSNWFLQEEPTSSQSSQVQETDTSPTPTASSNLPNDIQATNHREGSALLSTLDESLSPRRTCISRRSPPVSSYSSQTNITNTQPAVSIHPTASNHPSNEVMSIYFVVKRSYGPL